MDYPGVLTPVERREVQCEKYQLSFYDGEGPVVIQAQDGPWKGSLWNATGKEAEEIIGYVNAGNLKRAEAYMDMILEKTRERWEKWSVRSVGKHDL